MMDRSTKLKIESYAWDCTIGAGYPSEEEPPPDALTALARQLNRRLTDEDVKYFCSAWAKCIQEAFQP